MKTTFKRCCHCNVEYPYFLSGSCIPKYNSPSYCPSCMEQIKKVLDTIPIKKQKVWLPLTLYKEMTIEKFKELYEAQEKKNNENPYYIHVYPISGYKNIEEKYITYNEVDFRLSTNKDTGAELLEMLCEQDVASGDITGVW